MDAKCALLNNTPYALQVRAHDLLVLVLNIHDHVIGKHKACWNRGQLRLSLGDGDGDDLCKLSALPGRLAEQTSSEMLIMFWITSHFKAWMSQDAFNKLPHSMTIMLVTLDLNARNGLGRQVISAITQTSGWCWVRQPEQEIFFGWFLTDLGSKHDTSVLVVLISDSAGGHWLVTNERFATWRSHRNAWLNRMA
jgi:hypothetical protein